MKKSILLSAVLVCTTAIAFGQQTETKKANPYTQTTKTVAPATTTKAKTTPAAKPVATKQGTAWKKPANNNNQPANLTGPTPGTKNPKKGGVKPVSGNRWTGGKAQGPNSKAATKAPDNKQPETSDKK